MTEPRGELHPDHDHGPNRFAVLSTHERAGGGAGLTGRGVTIALLDSGFHPHPDVTLPENRVVAYHDVWDPAGTLDAERAPQPDEWHGTQTCVAAAGNGFLSGGAYRGLASEARLVLVRVGRNGRISEDAIARGLEWILANQERYRIRIVSMSLGGDEDRPLAESRVNRLAEEAVAAGMVLIAAAGNSGCTEKHRALPPATAPSVIAVGGYDDANDPERKRLAAYCSSFGFTADGLTKPEIIAPAMWIAAPILPGTEAYARAETLSRLAKTPDHRLRRAVAEAGPESLGLRASEGMTIDALRAAIDDRLRAEKIVAAHYQHVDGTSFAAPIAASVAAQMLEANPSLSPAAVKRILLQTAQPVSELPAIRQGYGVLNPRAAVEAARRESHHEAGPGDAPRGAGGRLVFHYHDDEALRVELAGEFNGWDAAVCPLVRGEGGDWSLELPLPAPGRFLYKFRTDGHRWIADPANPLREPDPYGGLNSVLIVPSRAR